MLVSEEKITSLIPQRIPMVMIHRLISCDDKQVITQFEIRKDNIFLDEKGLTASGLMENMAQTAAVRIGYLMMNKPGESNKKPPVGVIGSIKNFRMLRCAAPGAMITTTVYIEHELMNATVVTGKVEVDGKLAAESNLQIFIKE